MKGLINFVVAGALLAQIAVSDAQVKFSEILVNVPATSDGSVPGNDNGREFIEIMSDSPNYSLDDLWILEIDGDGAQRRGRVNQILPLQGLRTGSNGLLLWRDSGDVLLPTPATGTTIVIADFSPDLENGSTTYLLVRGLQGISVGDDLDADNDGILDSAPWEAILDGFSWQDNDTTDPLYAGQFGLPTFPYAGFTPDSYVLKSDGTRVVSDVLLDTYPLGPFKFDTARMTPAEAFSADCTMTPGNDNSTACPPVGIEGDVNGDGCVNDEDLLAVLFAFGISCDACPEDVSGNGSVDDEDLLIVLFNFGSGC